MRKSQNGPGGGGTTTFPNSAKPSLEGLPTTFSNSAKPKMMPCMVIDMKSGWVNLDHLFPY